MAGRLRSIRRVLEVQRQLQRLEQMRLRELQQREARLAAVQEELFQALGSDDSLHSRFAELMARHAGRLAGESEDVAVARDQQADVVRRQTARLKQAERLELALGQEDARDREKMALGELTDLIAGTGRARLR